MELEGGDAVLYLYLYLYIAARNCVCARLVELEGGEGVLRDEAVGGVEGRDADDGRPVRHVELDDKLRRGAGRGPPC